MQISRRQSSINPSVTESFPPILSRILGNRNIQSEEELVLQTKALLHYKSMLNINKAANIIADAIKLNKKVVIVGDFDADGATSTSLCLLALRAMGHKHYDYIVPNRFDYGYGLTPPVVDMAKDINADLIITVDNGISSIQGVSHAKSLGVDVVITDHHLPGDELPIADAIVNPNQKGCQFESKNLAGVGVAFYTMLATKNILEHDDYFSSRGLNTPNLAEYLDIVAVGTVADVVPLDKNNRILVHQGIMRIRAGRTRPGILALLQAAGRNHKRCCSTDIGFSIGPRLNAAGRLEDMSCGIECLLTDNENKAINFAAQLDGLNQSRREIEASMREDAEKAMQETELDQGVIPACIVLYKDDFHQGVIGIVAGRLKEKYYRPTIVFANDNEEIVKGSARSIPGVHMRDLLALIDAKHPDLIIKFGGHAMAAGLSIYKRDLVKFKDLLNDLVTKLTQALPKQATIYSDGELNGNELTLDTASILKYTLPWGQGFEEPIFDGVFEIINQRIVGGSHLKLTLKKEEQVIDAIAFNVDINIWPNQSIQKVNIAYKLDINEFRGQTNPQLLISLIEPIQ